MMGGSLPDWVVQEATSARDALRVDPVMGQCVDPTLPIPRPFVGSGEIRLVIIGQDPTVQNPRTRAAIRMVLTLDRSGHLRRYLEGLCADLGLSLDEHVYATNACKCFFTSPPTTILREHGIDVLEAGASRWLPILRRELSAYPGATVISLGQPVLSVLVRPECCRNMRDYWGYAPGWKGGRRIPMRAVDPDESTIGRRIHPFVHQPTQRGARTAFYRERRAEYVAFIRDNLNHGTP